jgi:hypothetical protein
MCVYKYTFRFPEVRVQVHFPVPRSARTSTLSGSQTYLHAYKYTFRFQVPEVRLQLHSEVPDVRWGSCAALWFQKS